MSAIQKSLVTEIRQEYSQLVEHGKQIQRDWIEFYLGVLRFREEPVNGTPRFKLAGFANWEAFVRSTCKDIQEARSTFLQKLRIVNALPPAKIRELGKTKSAQVARLKRHGKMTEENIERVKRAPTAEHAKAVVKKIIDPAREVRREVKFLLTGSQADALEKELERSQQVLHLGTRELAFDKLLSRQMLMTDEQLAIEDGESPVQQATEKVGYEGLLRVHVQQVTQIIMTAGPAILAKGAMGACPDGMLPETELVMPAILGIGNTLVALVAEIEKQVFGEPEKPQAGR